MACCVYETGGLNLPVGYLSSSSVIVLIDCGLINVVNVVQDKQAFA